MKVIKNVKDMQQQMIQLQHKTIGFVPTMGFFHEGHISLIKKAREENEIIVVSIFVNPLQFGPNEDLETYPRDQQHDLMIAQELNVDFIFAPEVHEMYPKQLSISIQIEQRTDVLCGRSRPGHFNGVAVVLTKLFNIVQPKRVYFGMKDAQQTAVVDGLITDFNFPIQLIGLPTIREKNGLAKSSRNIHLSAGEKHEAAWLYQALKNGRKLLVDGEKNPVILINEVKQIITDHTSGSIDYVELLSYPALQPVFEIKEQVILAVAVTFTQVRLIDNILLSKNGEMIERL